MKLHLRIEIDMAQGRNRVVVLDGQEVKFSADHVHSDTLLEVVKTVVTHWVEAASENA